MKIVQAPHPYTKDRFIVFLSGSIAMGEAELWQKQAIQALQGMHVLVLNPRRDDWDTSYRRFAEQVTWELQGLEDANVILMYFDPTTQSPITLLELGLCAIKAIYVACPQGFWRRGNIEAVCDYYAIPLFQTLQGMLTAFRAAYSHLKDDGDV